MSTPLNISLQEKLHKWSFLLVAVVAVIAVLTLAGWITNTIHHKDTWIDSLVMYPLTAIYFLLISSAFYLLSLPQKKFFVPGYIVVSILLIIVPLKLTTDIFQLQPGIQVHENNPDTYFLTHVPPAVSIGFIIALLALLCKHMLKNRFRLLGQATVVLLLAWCLVILTGKIIWTETQSSVIFSAQVAVSAIICFTLFALAVLFFHTRGEKKSLFSHAFPDNILSRFLIPVSVIVTSLLGLFVLSGYHNQQYSAEHGFAYYVLAVVLILIAFYVYNAFLLDKRDTLKEKTDQALQESEEQVRVIFESVPEGIILLDTWGKIYSWNREASVILGWRRDEAKGKDLVKLIIPPSHHELCTQLGNNFLYDESPSSAKQSTDLPAVTKDGNPVDISLRISAMVINQRKFLVWFIHDITIRKSLERQLQTFNESLEKEVQEKTKEMVDIFERVTDGFAALDKDCSFTYVNRKACEMFRTNPAALLGKCVWDLYPVAVGSATYNAIMEAMRTQKHTQSVDLYAPLGLWQEYNLYPSANGVSVFVKDITAQKKKEKEVEEATTLANKLIDSLPGVFYFFDTNNKFIKWNKQLEEVTGYTADEIAVMSPLQLLPAETREYMSAWIATAFEQGVNDAEADFLSKTGKRTSYYFKAVLLDYNGIPCLLGSGIDITERKKSGEKLKKSYNDIRELTAYLNKVREEERMRISHEIHDELGQLLTVLKMNISWINKRIPGSDMPVKNKINETFEVTDQTITTIRRIASELRPALLDNLGLHAAMEWHINDFKNRMGIQTEVKLPETEPALSDEQKTGLYRILQESLTNVARHSHAQKVCIEMFEQNTSIILIISDNGKGFDTSGHTLKTLGLLGMKERTLGMGGECNIESRPGKGTTVRVVLPLAQAF